MAQTTTLAEQVRSVCRTTVGDGLRSVVVFTPTDHEVVYVRSDLEGQVDDRFVENERLGFDDRETYNTELLDPGSEPDIGGYEYTIRVFSEGYVSRVVVGDRGVLLTTDGIDLDAFEEMAVALRTLLAEAD